MITNLFKRLTSPFSSCESQAPNIANKPSERQAKKARHSYLTPFYNGYQIVKTTLQKIEYDQLKKSQYDPYQVKQLNQEFHYDPYYTSWSLSLSYPQKEQQQQHLNHQYGNITAVTTQTDNDVVIVNKRKADVLEEDNDYDDQDADKPVMKRLRSMAYTVAENALYSVLYGTLIACDFLRETRQFVSQQENLVSAPHSLVDLFSMGSTATEDIPLDDICKTPAKKMRGYGVDFIPLVERSPALQIRIEAAERNIREVCRRSEQKLYEDNRRRNTDKYFGGLPLKRRYDDSDWGIVDEHDYSVQFMNTTRYELRQTIKRFPSFPFLVFVSSAYFFFFWKNILFPFDVYEISVLISVMKCLLPLIVINLRKEVLLLINQAFNVVIEHALFKFSCHHTIV
ncbi:hypothetical protein BD560DRAFT_486209 [Blakeslea trispora]|nr:hypothetical protein BD560DRAFT_486209 [Blakeslea trispora]